MPFHAPVMPDLTIECLAIDPAGIYVDATCGLGGHSKLVAACLTAGGKLIARDRDGESLEIARGNLAEMADRVLFDRGPFSTLRDSLNRLGIGKVNGILADCGVSRYQLTDPERGFSIFNSGPLDMRADRTQELTAADIVNFWSEREIADIILRYGEERRLRRAPGAIVRARPIRDTASLAAVIAKSAPRGSFKVHPATQVFQALRIAVNAELEELDSLIAQIPSCVLPGGRVVAICFQSLESRIVKRAFQEWVRTGRAAAITRRAVPPSDEEIRSNPASRSAQLRAIEWIS